MSVVEQKWLLWFRAFFLKLLQLLASPFFALSHMKQGNKGGKEFCSRFPGELYCCKWVFFLEVKQVESGLLTDFFSLFLFSVSSSLSTHYTQLLCSERNNDRTKTTTTFWRLLVSLRWCWIIIGSYVILVEWFITDEYTKGVISNLAESSILFCFFGLLLLSLFLLSTLLLSMIIIFILTVKEKEWTNGSYFFIVYVMSLRQLKKISREMTSDLCSLFGPIVFCWCSLFSCGIENAPIVYFVVFQLLLFYDYNSLCFWACVLIKGKTIIARLSFSLSLWAFILGGVVVKLYTYVTLLCFLQATTLLLVK